ncbi:unnamed protein product, partial [Ilex paraguariensis]
AKSEVPWGKKVSSRHPLRVYSPSLSLPHILIVLVIGKNSFSPRQFPRLNGIMFRRSLRLDGAASQSSLNLEKQKTCDPTGHMILTNPYSQQDNGRCISSFHHVYVQRMYSTLPGNSAMYCEPVVPN